MRVVFMGTPHFAVPALQMLVDSAHDIVAVYTQPPRPAGRGMKLTPSPVQLLAESKKIPVFTPASLKSDQAQAEFTSHQADIAVVAAYGLLLPEAILCAPIQGCINIHPSDLPRWRGAAPIQRCIMAGDTTTACCIMQMDTGLDTGAVLLRQQFPILPGMNAGVMMEAMATIGGSMVLEVLRAIQQGTATAYPQALEGITYAAKITKDDQWLDFTRPASLLYQQLLGLTPAPGALTSFHSETCKVFAARVAPGDPKKPAGICLNDEIFVNCGDGQALQILELQRPNKSRQTAAQLLPGWPIAAGTHALRLHPQG
jgi:methionyl-tRNA formyltransferase